MSSILRIIIGIFLLMGFLGLAIGKPKRNLKVVVHDGKSYKNYIGYNHYGKKGYGGSDDNSCRDINCENGGSCLINPKDGSATCICANGFSGADCSMNACSKVSCNNGGICRLSSGLAQCDCPPGFKGSFCEIDCNVQQTCPANFQELPPGSGNCFFICNSDSASHLSAQANCLSMGATLWEPVSSTGAEVSAVTGALLGSEKYWTGGYDGLEEGNPLYLGSGSQVSLGMDADISNTSEKDCIEVFKYNGVWVFRYRTCTVVTRRCICKKLGPCDVPAFSFPGFPVTK